MQGKAISHRQRTRLCAEYISDVSPDRKALYQQAKNAVKSQNGNPKCKGIGELSLLDFLERAEGKNNNLAQKNAQSSELKELPNYLEEKTSFDRKA